MACASCPAPCKRWLLQTSLNTPLDAARVRLPNNGPIYLSQLAARKLLRLFQLRSATKPPAPLCVQVSLCCRDCLLLLVLEQLALVQHSTNALVADDHGALHRGAFVVAHPERNLERLSVFCSSACWKEQQGPQANLRMRGRAAGFFHSAKYESKSWVKK